jgi:hypothetical protein
MTIAAMQQKKVLDQRACFNERLLLKSSLVASTTATGVFVLPEGYKELRYTHTIFFVSDQHICYSEFARWMHTSTHTYQASKNMHA